MSAEATEITPQIENKKNSLEYLRFLHKDFYSSLGLKYDPRDIIDRSYDVVKDRWHIESLREKEDFKGLLNFRQEMLFNLKTNLMERYLTTESLGKYTVKDGKIYSEYFPNEPFSDVIERGYKHRKENGSNELDREGELGELAGWAYIEDKMVNGEIGTSVISFSPPSNMEGSPYTHRFVDIFTAAEENGKRVILRKRAAVNWTTQKYHENALKMNSNYFKNKDSRTEDAWFLSHPILADNSILKTVNETLDQGLSSEEFEKIYNDKMLQGLIENYSSEISAGNINWYQTAIAFNAILNHADFLKEGGEISQLRRHFDYESIKVYAMNIGIREVKTTAGGGCPPNKGIKIGFSSPTNFLENSVAQFSSINISSEICSKIRCRQCGWEPGEGESVGSKCPTCGWAPGEAVDENWKNKEEGSETEKVESFYNKEKPIQNSKPSDFKNEIEEAKVEIKPMEDFEEIIKTPIKTEAKVEEVIST